MGFIRLGLWSPIVVTTTAGMTHCSGQLSLTTPELATIEVGFLVVWPVIAAEHIYC